MKLYAKKRVRKLIDLLRTVKPKAFNMACWFESGKCGTCACMAGYACIIKSFKKAGLGLKPIIYSYNDFYPSFNGLEYFNAIAAFFDITLEEAESLFTCSAKDNIYCDRRVFTPKQGARRLERFLKFKENEVTSCSKSPR